MRAGITTVGRKGPGGQSCEGSRLGAQLREDGAGGSSGVSGRTGPTTCPGAPGPQRKQHLSCPTARSVQEYGIGSQNVHGPFTVYGRGPGGPRVDLAG